MIIFIVSHIKIVYTEYLLPFKCLHLHYCKLKLLHYLPAFYAHKPPLTSDHISPWKQWFCRRDLFSLTFSPSDAMLAQYMLCSCLSVSRESSIYVFPHSFSLAMLAVHEYKNTFIGTSQTIDFKISPRHVDRRKCYQLSSTVAAGWPRWASIFVYNTMDVTQCSVRVHLLRPSRACVLSCSNFYLCIYYAFPSFL